MEVLIGFFVFIFGLIVGSFLNVLIYRLPRDLQFMNGRSFCPKCRKKINWFDNIPLFSFILLEGKCRNCGKKISWQYPIVELITGLLTLIIFNFTCPLCLAKPGGREFLILNQFLIFNFKTVADLVLTLLLVWGLIIVFFVDLEHQIIPDKIVVPLIILFGLREFISFFLLYPNPYTLTSIFSAAGSFLFLYLIFFVTKGKGMGFGDVKLAFLMGLVLGFPNVIIAFYIAFLTGAFIGIILILARKAKLKQKIAFGPFLVLGTFISLIWGEEILNIFQKIVF